ncbi:MAG: UvrD-helicase domain-containing protein [Sulfurimonas sp.]|jgi:F-box protein 18 (helicase)
MKLTQEQNDIIGIELAENETFLIQAYAGAAKTTTLVEYAKARPNVDFLYLAFNKSVADEAVLKFPPNVTCKTTHSLAFRYIGWKYKNKIENLRSYHLMRGDLDIFDRSEANYLIECVRRWCYSIDDKISNRHLVKNDTILTPKKVILQKLKKIWKEMCDIESGVPMSHDGYLKLYQLSKPELKCDILLVDESQDTNICTLDIFLNHKGRKIMVGDANQAIYHWRGAHNAIQKCNPDREKFLTTSFRFGKNIAAIANILLFNYKNVEKPLLGFRETDKVTDFIGYEPHTVISRTNGTLFEKAMSVIECGKKVHFLGSDSGYNAFLDTIKDVYYLYADKKDKIKDTYIASFTNYYDFKEAVFDKISPDVELQSRVRVVDKYRGEIFNILNEIKANTVGRDRADIILSTAHKSKGAEFDRVALANDFVSLVKDGKLNTRLNGAEVNLLYVAATRAKHVLQINDQIREILEILDGKENVDNFLDNNLAFA